MFSSQAAGYTDTTAAWAEELNDAGSRQDSVRTKKSKMLKRIREQLILRSFGNRANRDELLVALLRDSSIEDESLVEILSKKMRERININEYGMSQLERRLQILKRCRSEDERRNFHRVLTAVAPEPSKFGEQSGKTTQLCRRLRIRRNSKPYLASKQRAAEVDAAEAEHAKPLVAGALVVCRYGSGTLTKLNPDGSCTVQLAHGEVNFASTGEAKGTARAKGSGRIRRQPISFSPPSRAPGSNRAPDDVIHDIENYLETHCPTSPNHRDSIRHRHGPCQYEIRRKMFRYETWNALWRGFRAEFPASAKKIEPSGDADECPSEFWRHAQWNLVRGGVSTCLCGCCENAQKHVPAAKDASEKLATIMEEDEAEDDDEGVSGSVGEQEEEEEKEEEEETATTVESADDGGLPRVLVLELKQALKSKSKYETCLRVTCGSCDERASLLD